MLFNLLPPKMIITKSKTIITIFSIRFIKHIRTVTYTESTILVQDESRSKVGIKRFVVTIFIQLLWSKK